MSNNAYHFMLFDHEIHRILPHVPQHDDAQPHDEHHAAKNLLNKHVGKGDEFRNDLMLSFTCLETTLLFYFHESLRNYGTILTDPVVTITSSPKYEVISLPIPVTPPLVR